MSEIAAADRPRPAASPSPPPARRTAGVRLAFRLLVCLAGLALAVGFVDFAERVAGAAPPADPRAEGIVVLTGGTARIDGALQLLAEGRANRLLISGVNPVVTRQALASTVNDGLRGVLECCVDLDHQAQDTIGNAAETREWADRRGFASLIVVTSELSHAAQHGGARRSPCRTSG